MGAEKITMRKQSNNNAEQDARELFAHGFGAPRGGTGRGRLQIVADSDGEAAKRHGRGVPLPPREARWGGVRGGGCFEKERAPTRLASLATLPALATLAGEGWSTWLVRSFCLQIVADSAVEAGMTPLARAYPPLEGEA